MLDPRARIQQAINRSGISVRKLAAVGGGRHPNHTQVAKYLRRELWAPTWASRVAGLAEEIADLVDNGVIAASDPVERIQQAVEADRQRIEGAVDALRMLG